ncbi:hypothetical protein [Knoellia aerolata]|uniref:Uncharacterized protein n=1 Tax=Knoellia aerolata DSM 18566 TaxID=1385519 RepID=A0A0A0JYT2_9MICO|nr:hypothetical protein [Knoellia aerolata]KGN41889.1 hypothetical protein N801_04185 [Knoellia aerolata DSM 18566]
MLAIVPLVLTISVVLTVDIPNPISAQLLAIRSNVLALLLGSTIGPMAIRSRAAGDLWLDTGYLRRAMWVALLTGLWVALLLATDLPPKDGSWIAKMYLTGVLWAVPLGFTLIWDEAAGLLAIFAVFMSYVVTPADSLPGWWSPLAVNPEHDNLGYIGGALLAGALTLYLTNLRGQRRF